MKQTTKQKQDSTTPNEGGLHTKGEWKIDDSIPFQISVVSSWGEKNKPENSATFGDYRGSIICTMHYNSGVPTKKTAEANAELIVKAVNEREELIKQRDMGLRELHYMTKEDQKHREQAEKLLASNRELVEALENLLGYVSDLQTTYYQRSMKVKADELSKDTKAAQTAINNSKL